MPLLPNRPGITPGRNARTLTDVYDRLGQLITAIEANTTAVAALATAQSAFNTNFGTVGDTDCGLTAMELWCSINTALVGETPPVEGPPTLCPGYAADPVDFLYADVWLLPETELTGPTGTAAPQWQTIGNPLSLSWDTFNPFPEDTTYVLPRIYASDELTNACLVWNQPEPGYFYSINFYDADTGAFDSSSVANDLQEAGIGSHSLALDPGQYFIIQAVKAGGTIDTPPTAQIWLVQGPFG